MPWPQRGVYFFFEPHEYRNNDTTNQRVVRVGTHALTANSKTTLWKRLSQHRGSAHAPAGNHRGSIFRLLIVEALIRNDVAFAIESWGRGSSTSSAVKQLEREYEARVSAYLANTTILFLPVPDESSAASQRGVIERNAIALLSAYSRSDADQPSQNWLGNRSARERVRKSGLWNNRHVEEAYDPEFLGILKNLIDQSPTLSPSS